MIDQTFQLFSRSENIKSLNCVFAKKDICEFMEFYIHLENESTDLNNRTGN